MRKQIAFSLIITLIPVHMAFCQPQFSLFRTYGEETYNLFYDVYVTADGDLVMCGYAGNRINNRNQRRIWVQKTDGIGIPIWDLYIGEPVTNTIAHTIIELDNGDYAVGGKTKDLEGNTVVFVARITEDGELDWLRTYQEASCKGLIELKDGDLALAGIEDSHCMLMRLDADDGDVRWRRVYQNYRRSTFYGLRESGEEIVAGGWCSFPITYESCTLLGKFEQGDGDPVWMEEYGPREQAWGITSHPRGFILSGRYWANNMGVPSEGATRLIDGDGEAQWQVTREMGVEGYAMHWMQACVLENGDIITVGNGGNSNNYPIVNWLTEDGDELWHHIIDTRNFGENFRNDRSYFTSIVAVDEETVIACGRVWLEDVEDEEQIIRAFIMKIGNLSTEPRIYVRSPEDSLLTVLIDDTVRFTVGVRDPFDRDINYLWLRNGSDTLSTDTTVLVQFPELGRDTVDCLVSVGETPLSARWLVTVTDMYIDDFSPDSIEMTIQRGSTVDFVLDVRATEPDSVAYRWTLIDRLWDEREVVSEEDSVSHRFNFCGSYRMEGLSYWDESFDMVAWGVEVRGAIWGYLPEELDLRVTEGDSVDFILYPFDFQSDSLIYAWYLDDWLVGDTTMQRITFDAVGEHWVKAVLIDSADVDSVTWTVTVTEPVWVDDGASIAAGFHLLPPSPNPFNSSTTIRFSLPVPGRASLSVYDLSGRLITTLLRDDFRSGEHTTVWEAVDQPSGLYFVRLEAETSGEVRTQRLLLIR